MKKGKFKNQLIDPKVLEIIMNMGSAIRFMDEENKYCEYWLNDGDYIPALEGIVSSEKPKILILEDGDTLKGIETTVDIEVTIIDCKDLRTGCGIFTLPTGQEPISIVKPEVLLRSIQRERGWIVQAAIRLKKDKQDQIPEEWLLTIKDFIMFTYSTSDMKKMTIQDKQTLADIQEHFPDQYLQGVKEAAEAKK